MTVVNEAGAFTKGILGNTVSKSITLTDATAAAFTIAGGLVAVTGIVGRVTTAITTAATTLRLQHNPTAGTSTFLSAASADIGTTDTAAGELLACDLVVATAITIGAKPQVNPYVFCETGQIEVICSAGVTGVVKWYCTWVPIDVGATLVAAA
jgi:hypothetical protein